MQVTIEYETEYGKTKSITKDFNDVKHIDNHVRSLARKGNINIEIYIDNS